MLFIIDRLILVVAYLSNDITCMICDFVMVMIDNECWVVVSVGSSDYFYLFHVFLAGKLERTTYFFTCC